MSLPDPTALAAARDRFVAAFAHDLRSALTAIRVNAEACLRHPADPHLGRRLERIVKTVERTDTMLESLLDVSAVQSGGQLPLHPESINLVPGLQLSCANFQALFGHRMQAELPSELRGVWHGSLVLRAVDNLISNAFKYGASEGRVTLRAEQDERECRIGVHNEGPPIAAADRARIFELYERAGAVEPGYGIGLTLVRSVAEAHGGHVAMTSTLGDGTCFVLTLPRGPLPRAQ